MGRIPGKEEMKQALIDRQGKELQEKLENSTVAVCGLGGLGSHIAVSLARAGVGRLILIDFDRVDITNLHRQQYKASQVGMKKTKALLENIKEISPYVEMIFHDCRVTPENFAELLKDADIICEAFDKAEEKAILVNSVFEKFPDKYLIAASGMAGLGTGNEIRTRRVTERFWICGDETSDVSEGMGLVAPRVMLCAAHQAHTVIRILAGEEAGLYKIQSL